MTALEITISIWGHLIFAFCVKVHFTRGDYLTTFGTVAAIASGMGITWFWLSIFMGAN